MSATFGLEDAMVAENLTFLLFPIEKVTNFDHGVYYVTVNAGYLF